MRIFNNLFDILNSRNLYDFGFKKPLSLENFTDVCSFLLEAKDYIKGLKDSVNGRSIISTNRKTGFVGFCVCIESLMNLYNMLTLPPFNLKFVCTYKLSQDHLELFFGKIRRQFGYNNNPTVTQFISAFKTHIVHSDVQDILRGNYLTLEVDAVPILTVSSHRVSHETPSMIAINESRPMLSTPDTEVQSSSSECSSSNSALMSAHVGKICAYIAGYVVYKLQKSIQCDLCNAALTASDCSSPVYDLIRKKSMGSLTFPSQDVLKICMLSEKMFRSNVSSSHQELNNYKITHLIHSVLKCFIGIDCFPSLTSHMLGKPLENHVILLIRSIIDQLKGSTRWLPLTADKGKTKQRGFVVMQ
ncbi:hypothetical protein CAPTEDRAFT_208146 [Capitella teleta]|uniref:Transposable element P transposase n=1 Tax=Capitella teleta TaxID=283909 RepID=R7T4C9_CAPTE|nr:hypothetical protein CAPTEDRAFT_208146 [Capitella teleta]|eukprot:ELT87842.1 hypothetical protein CAPTEDRAFT_208146 [Capitella teleta]